MALAFVCVSCGALAQVESPSSTGTSCSNGTQCSGISITVSPGAPLLPEDFANVNIDGGINLRLDPSGGFAFDSNVLPFAVSVAGFSLAIPDHAQAASGMIVQDGDELTCRPGNYSLLAMPLDGVTPPINTTPLPLDVPGSYVEVPLVFATEADGGCATIHGQLQAAQLFSAYTQVIPISFNVQAFGADQSVASQNVTANLDGGYAFDLVLAAQAATTPISILVAPSSGTAPTALFTRTIAELQVDAGLNLGDGVQTVTAVGQVVSDGGTPVVGAAVFLMGTLSSESQQGVETFTSVGTVTDETGAYQATVVYDPSTTHTDFYSVLVVPKQASGLANYQSPPIPLQAPVNSLAPLGEVIVPAAIRVTGRVVDNNLTPTPGASVKCVEDPYANSGILRLSRPEPAITASDGTFSFLLTPGYYDFEFSPPPSLNLPSSARGPIAVGISSSALSVDGGSVVMADAGDPNALGDFAFSAGEIVNGTLVDANGNALDGAFIQVFVTTPASGTIPARSVQVSQAQVVAGGTFSVIIPASN